ncbi:hypothetical protein B0H11DRAFT_1918265 [Mycena galericulata]|nr:hypothetical protein B0H11DRAFT_1918265 [Mycena galericulata]
MSLQEIRGSRTRNIIRRIWDRECSTRAGSAVERTAGTGVADPEFHSADRGPGMFHARGAEIWGSRTQNFIRRIADPECSTRAGPYTASAVERTAVNTAASPLNARRDDAGMGRVLGSSLRPTWAPVRLESSFSIIVPVSHRCLAVTSGPFQPTKRRAQFTYFDEDVEEAEAAVEWACEMLLKGDSAGLTRLIVHDPALNPDDLLSILGRLASTTVMEIDLVFPSGSLSREFPWELLDTTLRCHQFHNLTRLDIRAFEADGTAMEFSPVIRQAMPIANTNGILTSSADPEFVHNCGLLVAKQLAS